MNSEQQGRKYVKHHSFETFYSKNGVEQQEQQRQRVIGILKRRGDGLPQALLQDLSEEGDVSPHAFRVTPFIADEMALLDDSEILRYLVHRYRYDIYPHTRRLHDYPPCVQLEPASLCNFRCAFCFQGDSYFSKMGKAMGTMDPGLFRSIVDQLQGHVEFVSLASRGEPLISKDIGEMLQYCSGKFLGLKLNTNASLLNERHAHAILSGGVSTLVFSVDAADPQTYERLRVGGDYKSVLRNIEAFKDIREKHYPGARIVTRVSGVQVSETQDMATMKALWGNLVDQVTFVKYNPWENIYGAAPAEIVEPCSDLWRRMFIWHDGTVNPCDSDFKSLLSVGDIRSLDIKSLWHSPDYTRLRQAHLGKGRGSVHPCRSCSLV